MAQINSRIWSLIPMAFTVTAVVVVLMILAVLVVGLSHHKKSAARTLELIGATGLVVSSLDPEGAVVINGELWRARTDNGILLARQNRVRVVGLEGHLILVEPMSDKSQLVLQE